MGEEDSASDRHCCYLFKKVDNFEGIQFLISQADPNLLLNFSVIQFLMPLATYSGHCRFWQLSIFIGKSRKSRKQNSQICQSIYLFYHQSRLIVKGKINGMFSGKMECEERRKGCQQI